MSCQCYVGAIAVEYAESGFVTASPCSFHSDNEGYYDISGTYVPPGSGHNDRVFGKRTTTFYFTRGSYWQSSDLGTDISIDSGASCPAEVIDTNFKPSTSYGSPLTPPTRDVFANPVLGTDLLAYALANADYGDWEPLVTHSPASATMFYQGALTVVGCQDENADFDYGNTIYTIVPGPSTVGHASVKKIKFRFSLAGPKLPVKVKYDLYNVTDSVAVSTDNEFTLNDGNPSQEVELPLTSYKAIRVQNIRFWFDPFHL